MNMSSDEALQKWNNELYSHLLPDTVILCFYIFVGIIGNGFVVLIYMCRLHPRTDERIFILYLAVIDIMACIICSSFGIAINVLPVHFTNDAACKVLWTFSIFSTACSVFTLFVIAVQRYLKICRPFGRQMTKYWMKIIFGIDIVSAGILSIPAFKFYGAVEVKSQVWNATGHRCTSISDPSLKSSAIVYKGAILLICIIISITLCVLYSLIGRTILKHMFRLKKTQHGNKEISSAELSNEVTQNSTIESENDSKSPTTANVCTETKINPHKPNVKTHKHRISLMFLTITVVFIICLVPKIVLMLYESSEENFWLNLTASEMGGYRFFYTFFIVNNIVNPFVYGFFDTKFRQEFVKLFYIR